MTINEPQDRQAVLDQAAIATASLPGPMPEVGRYGTGVIKWAGGFNDQTGKINNFGFIETKTADVFFHKSDAVSPWEQLSSSTPVMFRCIEGRGGKIAASEVGVLESVTDETILKFLSAAEDTAEVADSISTEEGLLSVFSVSNGPLRFFESFSVPNGMLRFESLKRLVKSASEVTLSKLADFIEDNLTVDDRGGLLNMLSSSVLLRQEAFDLRTTLPRHLHLKLIATLPDLTVHHQEAISALRKPKVKDCDESTFWDTFPPKQLNDPFYPHAPEWLKEQVCKTHYAEFLIRWNTLFDHFGNAATQLDAAQVYGSLSETDRELAALWAGENASEGVVARMLSARAAEKAAMIFYRDRGCEVEDVAIVQISQKGQDWHTHDLLVDGAVAVDVKNSRRLMNNKIFYVEHTVPRFKLDRANRNVRIAGVLSPYMKLGEINDPNPASGETPKIIYLGETHADHFEKLVRAFQTPVFSLDRGRSRTIPNWLFNYPAAWYKDYAANVRTLIDDCAWPRSKEWKYTLDADATNDALQKFCAIGISPPKVLTTRLSGWKSEFHAKLRNGLETLPRLPAIYLMVMGDFIEKLSKPLTDFSPASYELLLFPAGLKHSEMIPLGTIDPLRIVKRLIDALSVLWFKREFLQLGKLVTFRFTGLGILQGKAIDAKWTTILAYCGGSIYRTKQGKVELDSEGKPEFLSRCGHAWLVLGAQKTCNSCRCLICDKCQFCCISCETAHFAKLAEDFKENIRSETDYRQSDLRSRPAWETNYETGNNEGPCLSNQPPDWEIPMEAYESDY